MTSIDHLEESNIRGTNMYKLARGIKSLMMKDIQVNSVFLCNKNKFVIPSKNLDKYIEIHCLVIG